MTKPIAVSDIRSDINTPLWNSIVSFDFDLPMSEYGFTIRLANENSWTTDFTANALLEYRKFMYLAAVSEQMVSPSEIIDIVWHQHLIFTQSYADFCMLLGKKIEHVPSTHNRQEQEKFAVAKERTNHLYEQHFGKQPNTIWSHASMYEPLNLEKSNVKLGTFLLFGILGLLLLIYPMFVLLFDLYSQIDNPYFVKGYVFLIVTTFIGLEFHNRSTLTTWMNRLDSNSFIFKLNPLELICLKKRNLSYMVHTIVNKMIEKNQVHISSENLLTTKNPNDYNNVREYCIMETLRAHQKMPYLTLLKLMLLKPAFKSIAISVYGVHKYFIKSRLFVRLFALNFVFLSTLFLLGLSRVLIGMSREKPITIILWTVSLFAIIIFWYLHRLSSLLVLEIIPRYYAKSVVPILPPEQRMEWNYFLFGSTVLAPPFQPLVNTVDRNGTNASSGCGSSCSSGGSCGSSCGSSCGGCGGGD